MPQGTNTRDLQKLSAISWLPKPFCCHFVCLAALTWSSSPGFQGRNRQPLPMIAREFIPPHQPSPVAASEHELRNCSSHFLQHVAFGWISPSLSLWPLQQLAAWLLSMFDVVAGEITHNFLYWCLRMFVSLELLSAEYGVHKAATSQKSTHLQCRCNCFRPLRSANSHLDWVTASTGSVCGWGRTWRPAHLGMSSPC